MFCSVLPSAMALKVKWHFVDLPTSYLAECGFIWVNYLLSKVCKFLELVNKLP